MPCSCESKASRLEPGVKVHHKKKGGNVRVNGDCPSYLAYVSDVTVVLRYYRKSDGEFISETVVSRAEFDNDFEVCPGG